MSSVVVGLDGSDASAAAMRWALDEALLRDLPVLAVHAWRSPEHPILHGVVPPALAPRDEEARDQEARDEEARDEEARDQEARDALVTAERLVAEALADRDTAAPTVTPIAREDYPAAVLLDAAFSADQLVVGRRGASGLSRSLVGSVTDQVVRHARCPVTVIGSPGLQRERTGRRVVVGVDGSPGSRAALRRAAEEARARQVELHVVQAYRPAVGDPGGGGPWLPAIDRTQREIEQSLAAVVEEELGTAPPPVRLTVECGPTASVLLHAAQGVDLLVVGSRGRGGFATLLLGSVSMHCLHHATGPLQIVRPDGRE